MTHGELIELLRAASPADTQRFLKVSSTEDLRALVDATRARARGLDIIVQLFLGLVDAEVRRRDARAARKTACDTPSAAAGIDDEEGALDAEKPR